MEAVDIYLRLKSDKQTPTFICAAKHNGKYVAEALGNRPITSYLPPDASAFRDYLFEKGLALISGTGMRLAEVAGLHKDNIILDAPVPIYKPPNSLMETLED